MPTNLETPIHSDSAEFKKIAPDLQGNILSSHGRDHANHVFIRFKSLNSARSFIKMEIAGKITSAAEQKQNSKDFKSGKSNGLRTFKNFSLSHEGYKFFAIDGGQIPADAKFRGGMAKSRTNLNDPIRSKWEKPYQTDWHAVLVIANKSPTILKIRTSFLKAKLRNIATVYVESGMGIRNNEGAHIEHFGYVDGISQPHLLTDKIEAGKITTNNWDPAAALSLALVSDPGGKPDALGSYFVFRKLEQNVKAFKMAEAKLAQQIGTTVDEAGAQMVGRFRSGTPMAPPQPDPTTGKMNDFNYDGDVSMGSRCPFHAHIRKTNPRGTGGFESKEDEKAHLFPRRGITYGKDPKRTTRDPEGGVGLLFMAYNSNLKSQFEFMQSTWANNPGFPNQAGSPHGIDPVIGQGTDPTGQNYFEEWGVDSSIKRVKPSIGNFVTMLGGEYFFTPSISFLKTLGRS